MKKKKLIYGYDIFFFAGFALLIAGFVYMAKTGIGVPDESFYVTIPHRLIRGDRLILDDWHVSQFSSFMQYLPVKIYYELNGSYDGIILYLRYLYIVFQGIAVLVMYPFYRKYKWKGIVALLVFAAYVPAMLITLNYYTLCLWPAAVVCTVIFMGKKRGPVGLIILGFLTAIAVLAEPFIAFCFFIYTIAVLLKTFVSKKKKDFLSEYSYFLNMRYWVFITVGVFVAAFMFLPFLFRGSDPVTTLKAIPYLFNGYEYNFSLSGGNIQTMKVFYRALSIYGNVPAVGLAVVTVLAFVLQKKRKYVRPFLLVALTVFLIMAYAKALSSGRSDYRVLFYGVPLYLTGPALYFMLENRDKKLFTMWCVGALMSVFLDISSAVILGVCGVISANVSVIFLFSLIVECLSDIKESISGAKVIYAVGFIASVLFLTVFLGLDIYNDIHRLDFNITENDWSHDYCSGKCDTKLQTGAYRGIKTTKTLAAKYNAEHRDLDIMKADCGGSVLIFDRFPYCYLYMDADYATFSAWYVDDFEDERLFYYYEVYPDRIPEYIYLPKYDPYSYKTDRDVPKKLAFLESAFECTVKEGEAGYILKVSGFKNSTRSA